MQKEFLFIQQCRKYKKKIAEKLILSLNVYTKSKFQSSVKQKRKKNSSALYRKSTNS